MKKQKLFSWVLPLLAIGLFIIMNHYGQNLERKRELGWSMYQEDIGGPYPDGAILTDPEGRVWIRDNTEQQGLKIIDDETSVDYKRVPTGLISNQISALAFDDQGRAWIGTSTRGVNVYNGKSWISFTEGNSGLIADNISAIAIDKEGKAWIATDVHDGGLSVYDGVNWTNYTEDNSGSFSEYVSAITVHPDGDIWLITRHGDLIIYSGEMWNEITDTNPCLADKYVSTVSFDDQGRAWIGTKGDGLVILQGEDCDFYTTANSGLNNDFISRIEFDPQGRVWIGTAGGGVNLLDGEKWIEYTPFNTGLMDYSIRDIAFDTQNQVWIMYRYLGISIADLDQITSIPTTPLNILLLTPSARWFLPMILIGLFLQLNLPVMTGRDIRSIHIRVNRWVFWFGWIVANTLGFGLGHIFSLKIIHEHAPLSIGDPHPISSVALPILLILFFEKCPPFLVIGLPVNKKFPVYRCDTVIFQIFDFHNQCILSGYEINHIDLGDIDGR